MATQGIWRAESTYLGTWRDFWRIKGDLGVSGDPNSKLGGALEKDRGHKEDLVGHEVTWGNMGT